MPKRIGIDLPDELHARIKQAADDDRRSIHSQILWLLEQALKGEAGATCGNRRSELSAGACD
jgi:hypothetical protein